MNDERDFTTDPTDRHQKAHRKYYKQLYVNKHDNFKEMNNSLKHEF